MQLEANLQNTAKKSVFTIKQKNIKLLPKIFTAFQVTKGVGLIF